VYIRRSVASRLRESCHHLCGAERAMLGIPGPVAGSSALEEFGET